MKKKALIYCLFLFFFSGTLSSNQIKKYRIEGTIGKSFDGQYAKLSLRDDNQAITHTDISIIDLGRFSFEGDEYLNNISSITIEDRYGSTTHSVLGLLLESGNINVSFNEEHPYVGGTLLNDVFMEYLDSMRYFRTKKVEIEPQWENSIVINLKTELGRLYYNEGEFIMNFIKRNFTNPLGKSLFMSCLDIGFIPMNIYVYGNINDKKLDEIFSFVDDETKIHPRFISYIRELENTITNGDEMHAHIGKEIENFTCSFGKQLPCRDIFTKRIENKLSKDSSCDPRNESNSRNCY